MTNKIKIIFLSGGSNEGSLEKDIQYAIEAIGVCEILNVQLAQQKSGDPMVLIHYKK